MIKYRVKLFGGQAAKVEEDINSWLDSSSSIKVVKMHRPVSHHHLYVMVEYTQEVEDVSHQR